MSYINFILLSAWFQIILLIILFFIYSRQALRRNLIKGYALGWMLGLFFIFTYSSLTGISTLYMGAYDRHLNIFQIFGVTSFAIFVSIGMSIMSYLLRGSTRWISIQTAISTAILLIAIFLQVVAAPEIRLMLSLFIIAFGIATLFVSIIRGRRYDVEGSYVGENAPYSGYGEGETPAPQQPNSRLEAIRQRIVRRVNQNDVPSNFPHSP